MLLVYLDVEDAREAILLAEELWNDGIVAYVPNLAATQQLVSPRPDEEWALVHGEYLDRSDAVLVTGDGTITVPREKPVFHTFKELLRFFRDGD